jgi:hypothetical protein
MTTQIPHFIDGQRTAGQCTRTGDVFNPSTQSYTKVKTVTSRWPSGIKNGAEFVIPTMK